MLESEINEILRHMGMDEAKPKVVYQVGESVQVKTGPFQNFIGSIEEVYPDKGKIKVLVAMFGRETPVELDYGQVQKLD